MQVAGPTSFPVYEDLEEARLISEEGAPEEAELLQLSAALDFLDKRICDMDSARREQRQTCGWLKTSYRI